VVREPSKDEVDVWMLRLSQGERARFDPLFRALYPRALRLAHIKVSEDHAVDVAQSIMMRVFARASEFEAGRPVLPWFYAIAANQLRTEQRRATARRTRAVPEERAHGIGAVEDPERQLLERELRASLAGAIAALDEDDAQAIACMLDDRPRPAISPQAFRKRVSRAYAKLRLLLGGIHAK
jgi:RNA polymerase sigma factor (sigma-70 family)